LAKRKLDQIHTAAALLDLRAIPGKRLEALAGGRAGQHSIRIKDQWRICLRWADGGGLEMDYH
jgi:proteic killer suppression protein